MFTPFPLSGGVKPMSIIPSSVEKSNVTVFVSCPHTFTEAKHIRVSSQSANPLLCVCKSFFIKLVL